MAENNTTLSQDLVCEGSTTSMSNYRCTIAIDAAAEIQALSKTVRMICNANLDDENMAIRGISSRVDELSSIIMGALGEAVEKTTELAYRLRLEHDEALA